MIVTVIFQSTPSAWRETAPSASNKNLTGKFQSTPSAWRETIRQKQRVAVAVSMICGKDLLVFDEPTSGLDFDSMTQVAGLIRRLSNMGKVIFIVTHDFEFVCRTCSRVLHFDEGEIPDDVLVTSLSGFRTCWMDWQSSTIT